MIYAYVNGKTLPADRASISIFDRGIVLGDGLFETLRAVQGVPEFLREHYTRFRVSARKLKISLPVKYGGLGKIITDLCRRSRIDDAVVRVTLTRGKYSGGLSIEKSVSPTLIVTVQPVHGIKNEIYTNGVSVAISSVNKEMAGGVDPSIKTTNYLANIFAKAQADKKGCFEAILLGRKGEIAELSTSSFFCIKKGVLMTPPIDTGILPGITRQAVLKAADTLGVPIVEKSLNISEITKFDEAFLTSSIRGAVPIRKIEKWIIGNGKPGPLTIQLINSYNRNREMNREHFSRQFAKNI